MNKQHHMNNSLLKRKGTSNMMSTLSKDSSSMTSYQSAHSTASSGWGSVQSRKSYACLSSLADVEVYEKREVRSSAIAGDTWGYFVDSTA